MNAAMPPAADFMPHGMCLLWRPDLMALHVVADGVIALSYLAIPLSLFVFIRARTDLNARHRLIAALFAIFITACGFTHILSVVVLWRPLYELEGLLKALTAVASVATAVTLPLLIPEALRIPSPARLAEEVAAHKRTLVDLEDARSALARRVARTEEDLLETTQRFETALKNSPITVFEQDETLAYTWIFNSRFDLVADAAGGRSETDFFSPRSAQALQRLKLQALQADAHQEGEILVERDGRSLWFDVQIEPITLRDGRRGIIATAFDITRLKDNEAGLQIVMRELNHRSKNLLTIVLSLARQTARSFGAPPEFVYRLEERLRSLASAHDVLARGEWKSADLEAIVRGQLQHQVDAFGDRVVMGGPPVETPPQASHYLGMVLHELGSNAVKHGALSGPQGSVSILWSQEQEDADQVLVLRWTETGGPSRRPPGPAGFGSTILTTIAPRALNGVADLVFTEDGVVFTLTARLSPDPTPRSVAA